MQTESSVRKFLLPIMVSGCIQWKDCDRCIKSSSCVYIRSVDNSFKCIPKKDLFSSVPLAVYKTTKRCLSIQKEIQDESQNPNGLLEKLFESDEIKNKSVGGSTKNIQNGTRPILGSSTNLLSEITKHPSDEITTSASLQTSFKTDDARNSTRGENVITKPTGTSILLTTSANLFSETSNITSNEFSTNYLFEQSPNVANVRNSVHEEYITNITEASTPSQITSLLSENTKNTTDEIVNTTNQNNTRGQWNTQSETIGEILKVNSDDNNYAIRGDAPTTTIDEQTLIKQKKKTTNPMTSLETQQAIAPTNININPHIIIKGEPAITPRSKNESPTKTQTIELPITPTTESNAPLTIKDEKEFDIPDSTNKQPITKQTINESTAQNITGTTIPIGNVDTVNNTKQTVSRTPTNGKIITTSNETWIKADSLEHELETFKKLHPNDINQYRAFLQKKIVERSCELYHLFAEIQEFFYL